MSATMMYAARTLVIAMALASFPGAAMAGETSACGVRSVDWKNFKFPKSPHAQDGFRLAKGHADVAVETGLPDADPDTGYSMSLKSVEYSETGRSVQAFVTIEAAWNGPGNAGTDALEVFVFSRGPDCKTRHLGTIDPEQAGKLAGDTYVVVSVDGHRRSEWRVVN